MRTLNIPHSPKNQPALPSRCREPERRPLPAARKALQKPLRLAALADQIAGLPLFRRRQLREMVRARVAEWVPVEQTDFALAAATPKEMARAVLELSPRRRRAFDRALEGAS